MRSFDFCIKQEKQSVRKQKTVLLSEKALVFMVTGYHSDTTPALTISEIIHRTSPHSMALHQRSLCLLRLLKIPGYRLNFLIYSKKDTHCRNKSDCC